MEVIKTNMLDKLKSDAAKEIQAEFEEKAKAQIKCKMRALEIAKQVVNNIQRELEDLYVELAE